MIVKSCTLTTVVNYFFQLDFCKLHFLDFHRRVRQAINYWACFGLPFYQLYWHTIERHSFMAAPGQAGCESSAVLNELEQFQTSNGRNIQSIADYLSVARAFIKANSTLLSSAAVERLFSTAGIIFSPRTTLQNDRSAV